MILFPAASYDVNSLIVKEVSFSTSNSGSVVEEILMSVGISYSLPKIGRSLRSVPDLRNKCFFFFSMCLTTYLLFDTQNY